jgi:type IV secretory pathway VirB10-like protein
MSVVDVPFEDGHNPPSVFNPPRRPISLTIPVFPFQFETLSVLVKANQATPEQLAEHLFLKQDAKKERKRVKHQNKLDRGLPKEARQAEKAAKKERKAAEEMKAAQERDEAARAREEEEARLERARLKKLRKQAKKAAKILSETNEHQAQERKIEEAAEARAIALQDRKDQRKARREANAKMRAASEEEMSVGWASEDKSVSVIEIYLVPPPCHDVILHVLCSCPCPHFRPRIPT